MTEKKKKIHKLLQEINNTVVLDSGSWPLQG